MKALIICNDPPYGSERSWNGLRLAGALARRDGTEVRVFLLGDAVGCAVSGQKVPDGYYHLDRILGSVARHGGCGGLLRHMHGRTRHRPGRRWSRALTGPPWMNWPTGPCGRIRSSPFERQGPTSQQATSAELEEILQAYKDQAAGVPARY